jgi:site-specific DNA-methyltransferase (adenine-specific)
MTAKAGAPRRLGPDRTISDSAAEGVVSIASCQLVHSDCRTTLDDLVKHGLAGEVAMVFADPPYFLGNTTWDRRLPQEVARAFHEDWLAGCRSLLDPDGTVWVSGTYHRIHLVADAAERLGMRLLASITWEKPNPPPSRYHRCFTHATETLLWMSKTRRSHHRYNDAAMRQLKGGRAMHTHWRLAPVPPSEKTFGHHPTQKPIELVERCSLATTIPGDLVLDPFLGSGTTAVAALRQNRRCIGIERDHSYLALARRRLTALLGSDDRAAGAE